MKNLSSLLVAAFLQLVLISGVAAQITTVPLLNETGLPPRKFDLYAVGYSAASQLMLDADGKFSPIPAGSGQIVGHKIGGRGGLKAITLERSNPVTGAIVLIAVVPAKHAPPYVTYTGGGANIVQPNNPPDNSWPDAQGRFIYQFIEITQPATKNPTIDISMVNGFVMPISATINPTPRRFNGTDRVGQPRYKPDEVPHVNRLSIFQAYRKFLKAEKIPQAAKDAYLPLLTEAGTTDGERTAILNPGLFIASGSNSSSPLNSIWNTDLQVLFETPGRKVGMVGDDNFFYQGTAMQVGSDWVLDFIGYNDAACTQPNGNHYRVYSPLTPDPLGSYQSNESAGCMVFANDGVFADTSANAVISGPSSVALGLQRDIVSALNRGVALLGGTSGLNGENSEYWGRERNWYPEGSTYNVFSRFMHTARIGNQHINVLPRGAVKDAQGVKMGQSYGFAYDESPVHSDPNQPNVPSKFDPTPANTRKVQIWFGPWRPSRR